MAFVPIDNENTKMHIRSYQRSVRMPVLREITNFFFGIANGVVANQDRRVVNTQVPKRSDLNIGEKLIPADRPIALYRMEKARLINEAEPPKSVLAYPVTSS